MSPHWLWGFICSLSDPVRSGADASAIVRRLRRPRDPDCIVRERRTPRDERPVVVGTAARGAAVGVGRPQFGRRTIHFEFISF